MPGLLPTIAARPAGATTTEAVCPDNVPIYAVNDQVLEYAHHGALNGGEHGPSRTIGLGGWNMFSRVLGGQQGRIYGITKDGAMYRYQWNGHRWTTERDVISRDWRFHAGGTKLVTIDQNGDFYSIDADGNLHWRSYNEHSRVWEDRIIDRYPRQIDLITAAGSGVIYARTTTGQLLRSRYEAESHRWIQHQVQVGDGGWGIYSGLTSPGADVLYALLPGVNNGQLRWYRYLEDDKSWHTSPSGVTIGHGGWNTFRDVFPSPDTCRLTTNHVPTRPQVQPNPLAPISALEGDDQLARFSWLDPNGQITHGRQLASDKPDVVAVTQIGGTSGLRNGTSSAQSVDGFIHTSALKQNSETVAVNQTVRDSWFNTPARNESGFLITAPALSRSGTLIRAYGLDSAGTLWARTQATPQSPVFGWYQLPVPRPAGMPTPYNGDQPTVHVIGNDTHIIIRDLNKRLWKTVLDQSGAAKEWVALGDAAFVAPPAAVTVNGKIELFGRTVDEKILRIQESGTTQIEGPAGDGAVAAANTPKGLRIATRGQDGKLWSAIQQEATFSKWAALSDHQVANHPVAISRADGTWMVTFHSAKDNNHPIVILKRETGENTEPTEFQLRVAD